MPFLYISMTLKGITFVFCSDVTCISSKGSHVPNMKPSIETATKRGALEMACVGDVPLIRHRITLFDLYEALKVSHSFFILSFYNLKKEQYNVNYEAILTFKISL